MISLVNLILLFLFGSLISYILTKVNKVIGAIFNFLLTGYALFVVWNVEVGTTEKLFSIFEGLESVLKVTFLGKFFALISLIVISFVAFFVLEWIKKKNLNAAAFNLFYMLMIAGVLGVFFSNDLLTLYVFWEIAVLGSFLIVPMGKEDSKKAAIIYVVISGIGSYLYLFATFSLYFRYGVLDFKGVSQHLLNEPSNIYKWFVVLFIASAGIAKSGLFPLHTWLRITHGNAPDAFSAVLSGQLVKMGSYVLAISLAVFPTTQLFNAFYMGVPLINYILIWLGNISIIIGTFMAIRQNDMKQLIAFSSIANGGYILVGLGVMNSTGFAGGLFHVFNHAIAAAMIFLSFAAVVYRTGTTKIDEMGGLIWRMPWTFVIYLVGIISLAGIPPTSGFISKWMIFNALLTKGMFLTLTITFIGSIGSFLYVFRPLAGVFLGQLKKKHYEIEEVSIIMLIPMLLLVFLTLIIGIYPKPLLDMISSVEQELGIKAIEYSGTIIKTSLGQWNTLTVFNMFVVGFIIAVILYLIFPNGKKVKLTDQYTGGEYLYNYDLYHYATGFYKFLERLYDKHPSFEKLYEMLANFFRSMGGIVVSLVYKPGPSGYVFWFSIVILILFWVRW
ncbi:oxidoreductase [Thermosipho melanesiensis]|uniref:NADH dehydrogenase (Quinone) n=2 Tax=Thermosipho melanesiensis TaxID=46541 RepID=A6LMC0_THEM4|nr:proton-conducting transporter membrane subunit [Thermosipho melanesiensis]ABR31071.1 NADH dehydrogenase (quinone) [Thermosipho melanesiensis BI429]APT74165.1 oxidoreductase [Thermosipho melanesiensis]OOC36111.1 oxidoreductase [Thermosipho melanesiensis]OOC36928.1 oxidoreductase [Thermosipho melanesiensis]OOC37679.1 oxidoreductase [Thermosipho melanesiensis]